MSDEVEAWNEIRIASYILNVPPLALFTGIFVRVMMSKDRRRLIELIVICILMILTSVANMVFLQLFYTYLDRAYKRDLNHPELDLNILNAC